jgi:hypothetical protein
MTMLRTALRLLPGLTFVSTAFFVEKYPSGTGLTLTVTWLFPLLRIGAKVVGFCAAPHVVMWLVTVSHQS